MHSLNKISDHFAEFKVVNARNGLPSAMHLHTGMMIHSSYDPTKEAMQIAESLSVDYANDVVLLGGGLGYLAEAMLDQGNSNRIIHVIEPDAGLLGLSRQCRSSSAYCNSPRIRVHLTTTTLSMVNQCDNIMNGLSFIVAPYFQRLSFATKHPLFGYVQMLRAEQASASTYRSILEINESTNREMIENLPSVIDDIPPSRSHAIVLGAGPSLDKCIESIRHLRDYACLIAVSGAVPALIKYGIQPDWVVAMEAKKAVTDDLKTLNRPANIIVFPSTDSEALHLHGHKYFCGTSTEANCLETRGGTSAVPALDFAMRQFDGKVLLIGLDLSNANGSYSQYANREQSDYEIEAEYPKYDAMRTGLERVIYKHKLNGNEKDIFHVLIDGDALKGAKRILTNELEFCLMNTAKTEVFHV